MSNYSSKIKTEAQNATIYNERYKKDVCEGTCNSHRQFIRNGIYRQQNRKANELNKISTKHESVELVEFEEPLEDNDLGFNVNLGMNGNQYLDYEIYMLRTNKKDNYLITEINRF
jgi:hypothetical protein